MARHIFQLESELQNIPEASRSFSVSEKLARYGSSALSGVEHLTLLIGRKSVALALIRKTPPVQAMRRIAHPNRIEDKDSTHSSTPRPNRH
jgi:hypothetical protein